MPSWCLGHKKDHDYSYVQYDRESSDQDSSRISGVCLSHSSSLASTDMVATVAEDVSEDANISPPNNPDPLCSPEQGPHPLAKEVRMFLAAWPILGKDSQFGVFQIGLSVCSFDSEENTLTRHIIQRGIADVLKTN